jgi:hypothetical protein
MRGRATSMDCMRSMVSTNQDLTMFDTTTVNGQSVHRCSAVSKLERQSVHLGSCSQPLVVSRSGLSMRLCRYIAPEYIDKGEISFKSDIFSFGIILIKLLTGNIKHDYENIRSIYLKFF